MRLMLLLSMTTVLLTACAHHAEPDAQPSQSAVATSAATASAAATPNPLEQLSQITVSLWLEQRGLMPKNLQMMSRSLPTPSGQKPIEGPLLRAIFLTDKPTGTLETWRVKLREDFSAWLVEKKHPEGQCVSVDIKPVPKEPTRPDRIEVDIQVVCRG